MAAVLLAAGLAPLAAASAGSTPSKYYAIYKLSGSFTGKFNGQTVANYSQTEKGNWTYREKFGPFSIKRSTAHVRTSNPTLGGGWSYQQVGDPSVTCHTSGKWGALNFPPTMKSTEAHAPNFDGVLLVLTAGPDPMGNYSGNPACTPAGFFGNCSSYIGRALATPASNCNRPKYFITDLSVSDSGLKHHHYVYDVSNTRKGSERVSKDCNQGTYYSCSYSWSGTVTFQPAG